jgi:hypothetical protein
VVPKQKPNWNGIQAPGNKQLEDIYLSLMQKHQDDFTPMDSGPYNLELIIMLFLLFFPWNPRVSWVNFHKQDFGNVSYIQIFPKGIMIPLRNHPPR